MGGKGGGRVPRYRRRASDEDQATPEGRPSDFASVLNWQREPFPEEFPEGPYGAPAPPAGTGAPAGSGGGAPASPGQEQEEMVSGRDK